MTDNEVIQALECCQQYGFGNCPECPVYEDGGCVRELMKRALDLIKRLQEEIERLKKENNQFADIGKMYSEIKSKAIKEFAEWVCEGRVANDPVVIAVRCAVKEMTEGATK